MDNPTSNSTVATVAQEEEFDISSRAVAEYKKLHLKDAEDNLLYTTKLDPSGGLDEDGNPLKIDVPITIQVYGPGSKVFAQAAAKRQTRNIAALNKKSRIVVNADEETTNSADWLADITGDFSANFRYAKAGDKTGREFKVAVFSDRKLGFLGDQIAAEVRDWANFSKGSANS